MLRNINAVSRARIEVQRTVAAPGLRAASVRAALEAALGVAAPHLIDGGPAEVTVRVVGRRAMRALARDFMGDDHATDVLSFPAGFDPGDAGDAGAPGAPGGQVRYLGDIAVCWPVAVEQAAAFGHPVEDEVALLCVHGLLHLLGWDHATSEDEAAMWDLTSRCLAAAGLNDLGIEHLVERSKMGAG